MLRGESPACSPAEHSTHAVSPTDGAEWDQPRKALTDAWPTRCPQAHAQTDNLVAGTPAERRGRSVDMLPNGVLAAHLGR